MRDVRGNGGGFTRCNGKEWEESEGECEQMEVVRRESD